MATGASTISRAPRPSSLADVLDLILDKGLVVDAYVRVSLAGIELLTVDARIVVASVDTYLRFAEAVNRLDLTTTEERGLPALFGNGDDGRSDNDGTSQERRGSSSEAGDGRSSQERRALRAGSTTGGQTRRTRGTGRRTRGTRQTRGTQRDTQPEEGTGVLGRIAERARR